MIVKDSSGCWDEGGNFSIIKIFYENKRQVRFDNDDTFSRGKSFSYSFWFPSGCCSIFVCFYRIEFCRILSSHSNFPDGRRQRRRFFVFQLKIEKCSATLWNVSPKLDPTAVDSKSFPSNFPPSPKSMTKWRRCDDTRGVEDGNERYFRLFRRRKKRKIVISTVEISLTFESFNRGWDGKRKEVNERKKKKRKRTIKGKFPHFPIRAELEKFVLPRISPGSKK